MIEPLPDLRTEEGRVENRSRLHSCPLPQHRFVRLDPPPGTDRRPEFLCRECRGRLSAASRASYLLGYEQGVEAGYAHGYARGLRVAREGGE